MASKKWVHNPPPQGQLPPNAPIEAVRIEWAKRLQAKLTEKGWNQSELGRKAGLSRDNISNYVAKGRIPSPVHLAKIAKALNCKAEELLPSRGMPSMEDRAPALDIRATAPDRVWLRVNQECDIQVAMQIMGLLRGGKA